MSAPCRGASIGQGDAVAKRNAPANNATVFDSSSAPRTELTASHGVANRDEDGRREWRKLPLQQCYAWRSLALFVIFVGAFVYALWRGG